MPIDTDSLGTDLEFFIELEPIDLEEDLVRPMPTVRELFEELEIDYDERVIELGADLFERKLMSSDLSVSCTSCHDLRYGTISEVVTSRGTRQQIGSIPASQILAESLPLHRFWTDRDAAEDALFEEDEVAKELTASWELVVNRVKSDPQLSASLIATSEYIDGPGDIDYECVLDAIENFLRIVRTPDSPFDRYLRGDMDAVSKAAKEGYQLFRNYGCADCHYGASLGGKALMKMGTARNYFGLKPELSINDLGRFNVTGDERDKHVFTVPSLRNVALTPPYFHDDSQATMRAATAAMAEFQLAVDLTAPELDRFVAFLETLTGEIDGVPLTREEISKR